MLNDESELLPVLAFSHNEFGHMNIYCADFYLNSYEYKFDNPHVCTEILVYGEHEKIVFRDTPRSRILEYTADLPAGQRYYFVKLVRDDGKYAVTAPVWIHDTDV